MWPGQASVIFSYYKRYCAPALLVSVLCCWSYISSGDIVAQLLTKVVTDTAILFFISVLYARNNYYYYNLHVSRIALLIGYFVADMFVLTVLLIIIGAWL